jgi:hypothetical protein
MNMILNTIFFRILPRIFFDAMKMRIKFADGNGVDHETVLQGARRPRLLRPSVSILQQTGDDRWRQRIGPLVGTARTRLPFAPPHPANFICKNFCNLIFFI